MNPLLIRRRGMMSGKALPYDSKVEYLVSKNNENSYIDTGIKQDSTIEFEFAVTSAINNPLFIFGSRDSSSQSRLELYINGTTQNVRYGYGETSGYITGHLFTGSTYVYFSNRGANNTLSMTIEGNTYSKSVSYNSFPTGNYNIYLYCLNNAGNISGKSGNLRCYFCKLWKSGSLVRDFIPVRVGTTGYMYDRVSGQLFGNAGTGAFGLGPDVI